MERHENIESDSLVQTGSEDFAAIKKILRDEDGDAAYVIGLLGEAINEMIPDSHTHVPETLRLIAELEAMRADAYRLKAAWLERYPRFKDQAEARR